MKNLGVIANCSKPPAAEVLQRLGRKGDALGLRLFAPAETARLLPSAQSVTLEEMLERMEALATLGGDGTMLRAIRDMDGLDKPVLGVNIGGLGFLTGVAQDNLERALECMSRGDYTTSTRSMAECTATVGERRLRYRAVNDFVLTYDGPPRIITLDFEVDGQEVTSYRCDGLVICTPTGSTGHSLAAGGPIVLPGSLVFVVSLICAHTLSTRPLVVPDSSVLTVRVAENSADTRLSVDGQIGQPLAPGDRVEICRSSKTVRFIHLPGYSYFSGLRQKLHWRGSSV
jgi:NAD+ kinase